MIIGGTDPVGHAECLFTEASYHDCLRVLGDDGLLLQQSESPLDHMDIINPLRKAMGSAGFRDVATLFFPQPCYPSGWWAATLAGRHELAGRFREADARNRQFRRDTTMRTSTTPHSCRRNSSGTHWTEWRPEKSRQAQRPVVLALGQCRCWRS